jgi:3-phytase
MLRADFASLLLGLGTAVAEASPRVDAMGGRLRQLEAVRGTSAVHGDADDCAIWIHPTDPERSLVLGTDKARDQGIHVWDLQGRRLQFVRVERPNNIDVRQDVRLGGAGAPIDIAVVTVRGERGLRVYGIDRGRAGGPLVDITVDGGIPTPELGDPYGLCLYVRHADGAVFAFASTAAGDRGRVHQYRLETAAGGRVQARHVRALGEGAIRDKVEGLVADDSLGLVYAADEKHAVFEFGADPDSSLDQPLCGFARDDEISGDREGLGLYRCERGSTYVLLSSQANHAVKVYRREDGARGATRFTLVATYTTPEARQTDGLEVTSRALGAEFPGGVLLKHDAPGRRFMFYAWPPEPRVGCQEPEGGWPDQLIR